MRREMHSSQHLTTSYSVLLGTTPTFTISPTPFTLPTATLDLTLAITSQCKNALPTSRLRTHPPQWSTLKRITSQCTNAPPTSQLRTHPPQWSTLKRITSQCRNAPPTSRLRTHPPQRSTLMEITSQCRNALPTSRLRTHPPQRSTLMVITSQCSTAPPTSPLMTDPLHSLRITLTSDSVDHKSLSSNCINACYCTHIEMTSHAVSHNYMHE